MTSEQPGILYLRPLGEEAESAQLLFFRLQGNGPQAIICSAHKGASMAPALGRQDLLEIVPYGGRPVRRGDVVFLLFAESRRLVVHRVVSVAPEGIRTRGDNARADDPWLLSPADITGQVVAVRRGDTRQPVAGGRAGLAMAGVMRRRFEAAERVTRAVQPIYRFVARWDVLRRLLPARFRPRIVLYRRGQSCQAHILIDRRVIGRWDGPRRRWQIAQPFRLLIDDTALPGEVEIGAAR